MQRTKTSNKTRRPFLATKRFLLLVTCLLILIVVILWKDAESKDLSKLEIQTEATVIFLAGSVDAQYRAINNSLQRLGNEGMPDQTSYDSNQQRIASLLFSANKGLKHIYWIDTSYKISRSVSVDQTESHTLQEVRSIAVAATEMLHWVPVYRGTVLQGFILGVIDIVDMVAPATESLKSEYSVRIDSKNRPVYVSEDWEHSKRKIQAKTSITLQDAHFLTIYCAPTELFIRYHASDSRMILYFGLLIVCIMVSIIYLAQNSYLLSLLSESRFRNFLEEAQLVAVIIDPKGSIAFCNDFFLTLSGYRREEILGQNWFEMFLVSDYDQIAKAYGLPGSGAASPLAHLEYPIYTKSDAKRWLLVNNILLRNKKGVVSGTAIIGEDITFKKISDEALKRRLQNIQALFTIDQAITGQHDLSYTLEVVLEQVVNRLHVDAAAILLLNKETEKLEFSASLGFYGTEIEKTCLNIGQGGAGQAAREKRLVSLYNLDSDSDTLLGTGLLKGEGLKCYHGVPLIVNNQVKGVLELFHRRDLQTDEEWLDFFSTLAQQAAIAVENATMFSDLQTLNEELLNAYDTTIEGWSRALDMRDKETESHTKRVTEMTVRLAKAAGMTDEQRKYIRWGALLHDIGKMGIPDHVLFKKEKLTDEEWACIQQHPQNAYELLSPIRYLQPAIEIPYCHHEKWDGSGYPRGLKGEEIPLCARLFAVVDVWDALLSDRPYRPGWPLQKVLDHIRTLSGTHFDPYAVKLFFSVLQRDEKNFF